MGAVEQLREAVKASGKKQVAIADIAGIPKSKLSKILGGHQEPTVDEFIAISRAIDKDPGLFFSDGDVVVSVQALREAHESATQTGNLLATLMSGSTSPSRIVPIAKPAPRREVRPIQAAASGNVEFYGEIEEKRKTIPRRAWARGARRIVRAIGDSMEGMGGIANGELAYVKPTRNVRAANGHIVVIRVGDALYLKTLEVSGRKVRLVSINREHPPIEVDGPSSNIELYGVVVDQQSP
ncbi:MAG TPA: LexA family transcriptional regulator [Gemmatimonadaceae bacterium]|jgi:phage repressor protein C with HTH and peptisase S24 domain|nr:LexA family transcriptional regulator [Gemmatimonadaceae bacterium]